jgi:hypothetical protein
MSSQVKIVEQKRGRWLWPVMGFILLAACTGIAYVVEPLVQELISELFPQFRVAGMSPQTFQFVLTGIVAAILLLVAVMFVAIGSRRHRPLDVKDKTLIKEREDMLLEKKRMKRRQRKYNQQMRDHLKENQRH